MGLTLLVFPPLHKETWLLLKVISRVLGRGALQVTEQDIHVSFILLNCVHACKITTSAKEKRKESISTLFFKNKIYQVVFILNSKPAPQPRASVGKYIAHGHPDTFALRGMIEKLFPSSLLDVSPATLICSVVHPCPFQVASRGPFHKCGALQDRGRKQTQNGSSLVLPRKANSMLWITKKGVNKRVSIIMPL